MASLPKYIPFETNLNLRNEAGEYNLLAELLSDKNNIPFIFVKFQGQNKASISERSDYGYGCILTTYGKDVFEIESNYIRCTIPFEQEVIDHLENKNVGLNVGLNVILNKTEKKVVELLIEDQSLTSIELSEKIGVTKRTIERAFKSLQEKKIIERIGSKRDGNWIVIR
ncbi:helix-turn-helix transcriptional regulator [Finegoldia magna]|uniref:helix-turn-helix transcriptional regulator n=1 Tax=Finegoldia magna TaxID=1260 RepID=UPI001F5B5B98|nr:winged helix-turn-helix transcriptional regulator [Finegoldia magna]